MNKKRIAKLFTSLFCIGMLVSTFGVSFIQAANPVTYWMGNYYGEVSSGDLNPFTRDKARGMLQPCGSFPSSGTVTNSAKMVTYLKYFNKEGKICTGSPYTTTFAKQSIMITNRFGTDWYTAPAEHEDVYALAANIYFTGYCVDHDATLDASGYYIE